MYNHGFDPYDMLIVLNDRMNRLEDTHNRMATAYYKTEAQLKVAEHSLRQLQQRFLELQATVYASRGEPHGTLQLNQERPSEV